MARKEAALRRGNDGSANDKAARAMSSQIITEYERGTFWAGVLIAFSFALMGLGSVIFGW